MNPDTGYRYYDTDQIPAAQVIRRFRDLGMPVDSVRAVLEAPDVATRNSLIASHLDRLESQLDQTQAAVVSLRRLLEQPQSPLEFDHRRSLRPWLPAYACPHPVRLGDLGAWWSAALAEIDAPTRVRPA